MPRPWHKSLIFWLGLPGLLFLLWAWVDSQTHRAVVVTGIPGRIALVQTRNQVSLTLMPDRGGTFFAIGGITHRPYMATDEAPDPRFPPLRFRWVRHGDSRELLLPHWHLLLLYLSLWAAAFLTRNRMNKRLSTP